MMMRDYETARYAVYYDGLYGVGYVQRKSDGAETLLILRMDGVERSVTARVGRESARRPGNRIDIVLDLSTVQIFDAETTKVLSKAEGPGIPKQMKRDAP